MASKFYYGLNTANYLSDIDNTTKSLKNIGIDIEDINIIRGLKDIGLTPDDIKTVSNLNTDIKKQLISLNFATERYVQILDGIETSRDPQPTNINANSRIGARAIKYKYIDFENIEIKTSDISTSRISSWSTFDSPSTPTSPIFYGGDLEIIPDSTTSNSKLRTTELSTSSSPMPIRYSAEVATHLIQMEVNGVQQKFYAIRGIPLRFIGFFKSATFSIKVNLDGTINPSWRIENMDNQIEYEYENVGSDFTLQFQDITSRERLIEFYYPPNRITRILMPLMNIPEIPLTSMNSLIQIDFSNNDLRELPDFNVIAPSLKILNLRGNNLTRTTYSLTDQISRIPSSLENLDISGCFDYNEIIDLSALNNLKILVQNSYYYGGSNRRMQYTGETPIINSSTMEEYRIQYQPYTRLDVSVAEAPNLKILDIYNTNISQLSSEYLGSTEIKVLSENMTYFRSRSNRHNIVDMSNQSVLTYYEHTYSRSLIGDKSLEGKISNCPNLKTITVYATDAEGNISQMFGNLDTLETVDVRWTRMSGNLTNNCFSGTSNLKNLYIAGSLYNTVSSPPFFDYEVFYNTPILRNLYVYNNKNITGELPDFSMNTNLFMLYLINTGLNGSIPSFNENINLRYIYLKNSNFSGSMPNISLNNLYTLDISGNNLESNNTNKFPELNCQKLQRLYLYYNNFSGPITSFTGCPNIQYLNLANNKFDFYNNGSFANNLQLRSLDLSNNNLSTSSVKNIINDMYDNWILRNRTNVELNLLGNPHIISDIKSDENINQKIEFLINTQKWSILL